MLAAVTAEVGDAPLNGTVLLPSMTRSDAEGIKLSTLPLTVIAGPPGTSVLPPITKSSREFAVMTEVPRVRIGTKEAGVTKLRGTVELPMIMSLAFEARE